MVEWPPPWPREDPVAMPRQPQKAELEAKQSTGMKAACMAVSIVPSVWLAARFSSYNKLVRVTAWVQRAAHNFFCRMKKQPLNLGLQLKVEDVEAAELFLMRRSQERSFPQELRLLAKSPPSELPKGNHLIPLHPFKGPDGLLHIGGLISEADIPFNQKHPILLTSKDRLTILYFEQMHVNLCHCGPTLLLSSVGNKYHCAGARLLARQVCHKCMICRKVSARAHTQLMGQLPPERVNPSRVFSTTGVDYCGPFDFKEGRGRRPKTVKGYIAVFVCFSTKAIHLEPASDQTTETFLAAMKRFVSRRNLPKNLHSDNGGNFIGARKDLEQLYQLLGTYELPSELQIYLLDHRMIWHNIPDRAPPFGGLWEAAVKSAKHHLKRVVGDQALTFEEMLTVTCQVEACLNSRPLGVQHSLSPDGIMPLTPAHFLTGDAMMKLRSLQKCP